MYADGIWRGDILCAGGILITAADQAKHANI
jgi:hypothetical protein